MLTLVLVVIFAALVFEFINGFHDTANSIATVVATKVLSPGQAVMLAAVMNLIGALTGTVIAARTPNVLKPKVVVIAAAAQLVSAAAVLALSESRFATLVGVILGPFFGAVIGELIHDRSDSAKAFRSGFGSFLAFIAGTGLKLVAAIWMICLVWSDTYPVVKNWIVTTF